MRALDVAVLGSGPAGLATALALTRAGHTCRIFERFDTPRPLGSGLMLQPTGLAALSSLGLDREARKLGRRIDRLFGTSQPSGRTVLEVAYSHLGKDYFGLAIHRAALFDVLFAAARAAGIGMVTGLAVRAVERGSDGAGTVIDERGRRHGPFALVVDAMGARSPLVAGRSGRELAYGALWTTLPCVDGVFDPHALEQRYERASVMIGVLPVGRAAVGGPDQAAFFWSLKSDAYPEWVRLGMGGWKARVAEIWPETQCLLELIRSPDQMTLATYSHRTTWPGRSTAVPVGDAFHATSPQLGQGVNMALLDACALQLALATSSDLAAAVAKYTRLRRLHVLLFQTASRVFTPFYQSDSTLLPMFRDRIVPHVARLPIASRVLASMVAGTLGLSLPALRLDGDACTAPAAAP